MTDVFKKCPDFYSSEMSLARNTKIVAGTINAMHDSDFSSAIKDIIGTMTETQIKSEVR